MITRSKANELLKSLFPTTCFIGLSKTTPTTSGGNVTEPASSAGYKRMQLTQLGTPNNAQVQNSDIIFFPESLDSWGTITHFCIYASESATTPYFFGELTTAVEIPAERVPIFRANALKIGLDKETLD